MNDLTFGATLLSFFVTVVIAAVVEITGTPPTNATFFAAAAQAHRPTQATKAGGRDCATVTLAATEAH